MDNRIVIEGLGHVGEVPSQITEEDDDPADEHMLHNVHIESHLSSEDNSDPLPQEVDELNNLLGNKELSEEDHNFALSDAHDQLSSQDQDEDIKPDSLTQQHELVSNDNLDEEPASLASTDHEIGDGIDMEHHVTVIPDNINVSAAGPEVIRLLLQTEGADQVLNQEVDPSQLGVPVSISAVTPAIQPVLPGGAGQTVQAVTLADGTTAFIQHPKGRKFLEGQTITLEDGSTAVIQGTGQVPENLRPIEGLGQPDEDDDVDDQRYGDGRHIVDTNIQSDQLESIKYLNNVQTLDQGNQLAMQDGQPVQLEDGTTAYLHTTPKEGLQAIQLEDGTTAYLSHPSTDSLFGESTSLEATPLSLEQLAAQISLPQSSVDQIKAHESQAAQAKSVGVGNSSGLMGRITVIADLNAEGKSLLGDKAFKCTFDGCGRLYTTHHHLKVHERSHTGDRPFKCDFLGCTKAFATGYGLKSHTRVHTGEKPYKCPEESCDKAFKTSGDLQKHVRTHTGERPFKCPFEGCERSFTTSNIRKVHIRTHTGERPYVCTEEGCGRAFASATNYKNHIRIHTGEKPYVCTVHGCGKRFTEYSSLYKHHVVHTHSKPYICNHCGKTYRQTSTLAMHKRTAHGEEVTAESEAQLFAQQQSQLQDDNEDSEPLAKRPKFQYALADGEQEGGNGSLVNHTSETGQVAMQTAILAGEGTTGILGSDEPSIEELQHVQQQVDQQNMLNQLQQQQQPQNMATITVGEHGQQVFVITDPAQLEALQQLAQQHQSQLDGQDALDVSSIINQDVSVVDGMNVTDAGLGIINSSTSDSVTMTFQ